MSRIALLTLLAQYVGAWKFEDGPGRSWEVRVPLPHTCFAVLERRRHRLILRRDSSCVVPRSLWQGPGDKPKIVCHVDTCNSLWSMGVREDQLVGYFGADVTASRPRCSVAVWLGGKVMIEGWQEGAAAASVAPRFAPPVRRRDAAILRHHLQDGPTCRAVGAWQSATGDSEIAVRTERQSATGGLHPGVPCTVRSVRSCNRVWAPR